MTGNEAIYRVLRLGEYAIGEWWPVLRQGLLMDPPMHAEKCEMVIANVMQALMNGAMSAWFVMRYSNKETVEGSPMAMFITTIINETLSGGRWLLLYTVARLQHVPANEMEVVWIQCNEFLKKLAKADGCTKVIAYGKNIFSLAHAKKLGWNDVARLIELEV